MKPTAASLDSLITIRDFLASNFLLAEPDGDGNPVSLLLQKANTEEARIDLCRDVRDVTPDSPWTTYRPSKIGLSFSANLLEDVVHAKIIMDRKEAARYEKLHGDVERMFFETAGVRLTVSRRILGGSHLKFEINEKPTPELLNLIKETMNYMGFINADSGNLDPLIALRSIIENSAYETKDHESNVQ